MSTGISASAGEENGQPAEGPSGVDENPRSKEFARRFGQFLLDKGVLDELAVRRAQLAQSQAGERFDLVLMRLGLISDAAMAKILADYTGLPLLTAVHLPAQPIYFDGVELSFLKLNRILPLSDDPGGVSIAVADPFNPEPVAALSFLLGRPVERFVGPDGEIERAIERLYSNAATAAEPNRPAGTPALAEKATEDDVRRLEDMASEAPVIRLVHELISRAVESQASDIHIEPREDCVRVRYRIDGVLNTVETLALAMRAAIGSRIKIMARLNIAERRLPQDGRIKIIVRGREIDLRVSTMPTLWGESIVLRILDRSSIELDFQKLGFSGRSYDTFVRLLNEPNGIILVTGPTGSGKTTTLYTALGALNSSERKIFTVEDPIEYQLPGVNQIQVQPKIGLTFATALRSILRQDPDIIMVGEIRDLETAQMAVQASLTGHLVLSTVHTNSAAATVTRLLDMGVERYLLASCLKGVLAQRLVREFCDVCASPMPDPSGLINIVAATGVNLNDVTPRPRVQMGCSVCRNTGFSGRTTIYELLTIGKNVRNAMLAGSPERVVEEVGIADGMVTMLQNGLIKALQGETTPEEVWRVTRFESNSDATD